MKFNWVKLSYFISENLVFIGLFIVAIIPLFFMGKRKKVHKKAVKKVKQNIEKGMNEPATLHPEINEALCAGCGSCVNACPEGKILQLIHHKAVLVEPTKCVGHGLCEAACPFGAIDLVFGTKTRGMDIPRISANYETNVSGLYIAGELGGMGLIRNAIKQGQAAAEHAIKKLKPSSKAKYDLLIVGAGPAGLAASLKATELKKKYLCIEQGSFGGTVYNFPRQKVVMTIPANLPLAGEMKFKSNKVSKEELLAYWSHVRKKAKLRISENTKFETLSKDGNVFSVKTNRGVITASKVILAIGVRGSPRKLGLDNEDMAKVAYNLIDPEQYQKQFVAIVGGGNAALEAAQYLSRPQYRNKVVLLVRGKSMDRANEENQNLVFDLEKKGLLKIWYESSVEKIDKDSITVKKKGEMKKIPNNYLFIFAGAIMPFDFLMSLGIKIDKKFGEALKKSS